MSIKLTKFDFDFFIKQQFILNLAMGVFGYLFVLTLKPGMEKILLNFIYFIYFLLVIFFYIKLRGRKDYISYSKHRIIGHFFVSFVFFIIGTTLLVEIYPIFLYFGIILYFILVIFFYNTNNKKNHNYDITFIEKINSSNEVSLHEFYDHLDVIVNKKNKFSPILVFLGMQVGLIIFINGFFSIDQHLGAIFIVAVFFLIAFYILNKIFFYLIVPYRFLIKKAP